MSTPGVAVLICRPDGTRSQHVQGLANLEHEIPISLATVFNVGSVAKQITAHLALLTAEAGHLDLQAPAARWLPRLKVTDVTVADLIQHHGGIRDAESLLPLMGFRELDHYTPDDLLELAYRQHQRAVPPGGFLYSNTGYLILTKILELIHRAPLNEIAREHIFDDADMTTATFKHEVGTIIPTAATAYETSSDGWRSANRPVTLPGPGSLWCSALDLARWLHHLQTLSPRLIGLLPKRRSDHPPWSYGAGLYTAGCQDFHHGHEQGFSAAAHLLNNGSAWIVLTNDTTLDAGMLCAVLMEQGSAPEKIANLIATEIQHGPRRQNPAPDALDQGHHEIGVYSSPEVPGRLRITRCGTDLYLWRRGTPDRLTRHGEHYEGTGYTITWTDHDGRKEFVLDLTRAPGLRYQRTDL